MASEPAVPGTVARNVDEAPRRAEPVSPAERIVALDVLRGVAVLGILIMNIQFFAMPDAAYFNPTAFGDLQGANFGIWLFSYLFANLKFLSLFSLLFGAGIALMLARAEARGEPRPQRLHVRRMLWLLVFGLVHAYLIWAGDILVPYATCGLALFWLHKARPAILITLGLALLAGGAGVYFAGGMSMAYWPKSETADFMENWVPDAETIEEEIAANQGGFLAQMPRRAKNSFFMQVPGFFFFTLWRVGGMMLLGMGLLKSGFFHGKWPLGSYGTLALVGGTCGIALSAIGAWQNFAHEWRLEYGFFFGVLWNYWGSLLTCLAYAAATMLIVRRSDFPAISRRLAAVGRMAFSNYILESILCTLIFYGHGLGLYARVDRVMQLAVVLGVWAVILLISPWWLRRHRFGPLEWLWRRLTYGAATVKT